MTSGAAPTPDTSDLRLGAPVHDRLLALLALVGEWHGTGSVAVASTGDQYSFGQRITVAHDGRPFLVHTSRTWLLDADGGVIRPAFREDGFWRPGAGPDDVELVLASAAGLVEVLTGVAGDSRWELEATAVRGTPTAREVGGERRLYAVVADSLVYATELGEVGGGYRPHLNATLRRAR